MFLQLATAVGALTGTVFALCSQGPGLYEFFKADCTPTKSIYKKI